jgi:KUP system potassium uptake protein
MADSPASSSATASAATLTRSSHTVNGVLAGLTLGALGVVFGDIGTSPLYAFREGFLGAGHEAINTESVFGLISVFFWTLVLVIGIKYAFFILRADNRGEGGIFALLALLPKGDESSVARLPKRYIALALAGAALLYADGLITPAISVLSALEGLKGRTPTIAAGTHAPSTDNMIILGALGILLGLFAIQRLGTRFIGRLFGPVMLVWFVTIGLLGIASILKTPEVLQALNPSHILDALATSVPRTITVLGAAMLCISGGEALYADLGHFGRKPIVWAWYFVAMPGLLLNYLGQGAMLIRDHGAIANPFYALVPDWAVIPMVGLATAAAIIASQSIITGMFSLTNSAILMGFLPRLRVVHTSDHGAQVYVPAINSIAVVLVCLIVITFRTSDNLAHAYGLSVAGGMVIVTLLYGIRMRRQEVWGRARTWAFLAIFVTIDAAFCVTNASKIPSGGWLTLVVACALLYGMGTWLRGKRFVSERFAKQSLGYDHLLNNLATHPVPRVPGTAVFLTPQAEGLPPTLLHHLKHNKMLHEQVVIMSIQSTAVPIVPDEDQVEVQELRDGFWTLKARHGFMQSADVPRMLRTAGTMGLETSEGTTTYFLGRTIVTPRGRSPMPGFQKRTYCWLAQLSSNNPLYFSIPPGRMIELGVQIDV